MAKRGSELSEHILRAAKEVFLEVGFERASMDEVANRAKTSKRSLYAHFESKEKLFLAVIDFVRELFTARLGALDYDAKPSEALALFCGQYVQALRYRSSVQMLRVCIAETARFPEGAAQHYGVMFTEVEARLASYLKVAFGISARESTDAAQRLLGRILFPLLPRVLFGVEPLRDKISSKKSTPQDLKAIRQAIAEMMASLPAKR